MIIKATVTKAGESHHGELIESPKKVIELKLIPLEGIVLNGENMNLLIKTLENLALNYCVEAGVPLTTAFEFIDIENEI